MARLKQIYTGDRVVFDNTQTDEVMEGIVIDYYCYEDDDGYDEESGHQIILRWYSYKIEADNGQTYIVKERNVKKVVDEDVAA